MNEYQKLCLKLGDFERLLASKSPLSLWFSKEAIQIRDKEIIGFIFVVYGTEPYFRRNWYLSKDETDTVEKSVNDLLMIYEKDKKCFSVADNWWE